MPDASQAHIGDTLIAQHSSGETRWKVVDETDTKIAVADDTAHAYRGAKSKKWYNRNSKIIAGWTLERGSGDVHTARLSDGTKVHVTTYGQLKEG